MKLTLGFSSCPNDIFIFDALVHNKINTKGYEFDLLIADVEDLNERALKAELDITKLSYHAFAHAHPTYQILNSGSALGYANGPLFICKNGTQKNINKDSRIAIPGKNTTANLLFSIAYPEFTNKTFLIFSDIEKAINNGDVDAGVIIHENRFTYAERGFEKITDLGAYWEEKTKFPIPLGAITIKSSYSQKVKNDINTLIHNSIEFAFNNPEESIPYIKQHAQELSEEVVKKHISLFVNDFSLDIGKVGKEAIQTLFSKATEANVIPQLHTNSIFANQQ